MKNEWMSGRVFIERINNVIAGVNGTEIMFIKNGLEDRSYEDARVKFTSGTLSGQEFRISSSSRVSVDIPSLIIMPNIGDKFIIFWDITKIPAHRFVDEIIHSTFYQEGIELVDILPSDATCTFKHCNLDNIVIPLGCTLIEGSNNFIKISNDLDDWKCNKGSGEYEIPLNKKLREQYGKSTDSKDISKTKLDKEIIKAIEDQIMLEQAVV